LTVAGKGRKKGPNLPAPPGLRTLLRRWVSTSLTARGLLEIDPQADCVGSQLERLSNKLEPSMTIPVTKLLDRRPESLRI
jgi:hypothetical protein